MDTKIANKEYVTIDNILSILRRYKIILPKKIKYNRFFYLFLKNMNSCSSKLFFRLAILFNKINPKIKLIT